MTPSRAARLRGPVLLAGVGVLAVAALVQASAADGAAGGPVTGSGPRTVTPGGATPGSDRAGGPDVPLWTDEFDGLAGAGVDRALWAPETGAGGWGNAELQNYTDRPENLALDGRGHLAITLLPEASTDARGQSAVVTSARLKTVRPHDVGRLEVRMRVPQGAGLWSAFWTLGASHDQVGWPRSGEVDVVEVYDDAAALESVAHAARLDLGGEPTGKWREVAERAVPGGLADDFHVYAVDMTADRLVYSLDGSPHLEVRRDQRAPGEDWPFDQGQYVLLNLAMARWGQLPSGPETLLVDYVRAYPRTDG